MNAFVNCQEEPLKIIVYSNIWKKGLPLNLLATMEGNTIRNSRFWFLPFSPSFFSFLVLGISTFARFHWIFNHSIMASSASCCCKSIIHKIWLFFLGYVHMCALMRQKIHYSWSNIGTATHGRCHYWHLKFFYVFSTIGLSASKTILVFS